VVELIPESYVIRLDLRKTFGRDAPLHVDLGCGDGSFLLALAAQIPRNNFLGVERLLRRVRSASRKAVRVNNVRILRAETSYVVRYLLPEGSVETFYLLFPDPWPKRRHHRRRIVTKDFLMAAWAALAKNGTVRIATDQSNYFNRISQLAEESTNFAAIKLNGEDQFPPSTFEKKFKDAGAQIYRLELRKVSPVT
jgi:tRNA (guanine-N7-)-methyltransferase